MTLLKGHTNFFKATRPTRSRHAFMNNKEPLIQYVIQAIGLLHVLCEVVKSGSVEQVQDELPTLLSIPRAVQQSTYSNNNIIRKLKTKLISRIGLRLLPTSSANIKRKGMFHSFRARAIVE